MNETKKIQLIGITQTDYIELIDLIMRAPYGHVKKFEPLIGRIQQSKIIEVIDDNISN